MFRLIRARREFKVSRPCSPRGVNSMKIERERTGRAGGASGRRRERCLRTILLLLLRTLLLSWPNLVSPLHSLTEQYLFSLSAP
ncbi:hypothetical protein E2C01_008712 [Portunus trituberculatus]|uniref:Uncharacterized protein n=1 Tax=Portunus trituberculatus TaxID=210409 RepID=A0A5B7D335_PORTR|nr:hypothetical protein [Portunus trituberculatus]